MGESKFRHELRVHAKQGVKKVRAPFFRVVFSRTFLAAVSFILQILLIYVIVVRMGAQYRLLPELSALLSGIIIIGIINSSSEPTYKLSWSLVVAVLPLMGVTLYLMAHLNIYERRHFNRINETIRALDAYASADPTVQDNLAAQPAPFRKMVDYVESQGGFPVHQNTRVTYYSMGEDTFDDILDALEAAERFIFMEFFIIQEGVFWDNILDILEKKAKDGVEVRVLYDGVGCLSTLPYRYNRILEAKGIQSHAFSPITPFFATHYNNRDHRKIIVVDGKVAFSGGFNLADEYLNLYERFGRWKDNGFRLEGDAVRNYTLMFLHMWNLGADTDLESARQPYMELPDSPPAVAGGSFVLPYGDGPNNPDHVAKNVYLDLINGAEEHVHIMTPYLIPDNDTLHALKHAARSQVGVHLIIPHIPDKKIIYYMSRSYVKELIQAGVRIYEYMPGFVHTKMVAVDDRIVATGTINLDFRSLYLHYECGTVFYKDPSVAAMERDFAATLTECREITQEEIRRWHPLTRFIAALFRVFAPLV